jgi:hypothetical protein
LFDESWVTYLVSGFEVGEKGTPHIQGYMHFSDGKTMRQICNLVTGISLQEAKAQGENFDRRYTYCMKDGDYYEMGERPMNGVTTSTAKVIAAIKEGKTIQEMYDLFPSYMIHHSAKVKQYYADTAKKEDMKFYVMDEEMTMNMAIQTIYHNFDGAKLACVTELQQLEAYSEKYDTVVFFAETFDKLHLLWPYGAPVTYKYGYQQKPINCERFIVVTTASHLYGNYKKIKI